MTVGRILSHAAGLPVMTQYPVQSVVVTESKPVHCVSQQVIIDVTAYMQKLVWLLNSQQGACSRRRVLIVTNTAVQRVVYFQLWRWMFFFCGFVPIWWTSFYIMRIVTIIVESRLFPFKQVLYYIIGVRVSPCSICAALLLLQDTDSKSSTILA